MKIVVLSDTHGDGDIIPTVVAAHPDADAYFHCGDSELAYDDPRIQQCKRVRGNCDGDIQYPVEEMVTIEDRTIFMTHGHLFNVKTTLTPLSMRAREVAANIILFGHSHVLGAELVDDTLFLNPGSLRLPRGRKEKSYAVIEWQAGQYDIRFLDEQHQLITAVKL